MEDEDQSSLAVVAEYHHRKAAAAALAAATVASMNLPLAIPAPSEFDALGESIGHQATGLLRALSENHQDSVPFLIAVALREMWFAAWSSAHMMKMSHDAGNPCSPTLWTAGGYAQVNGGWTYTLYDELANVTPTPQRKELLAGTPFVDLPSQSSLLIATSVYWFTRANEAVRNASPSVEVFEFLHEAYCAAKLDSDLFMWDEGFKMGKEEAMDEASNEARKVLARKAAAARHSENRAMKQDVFHWCDENMAQAGSMDAAASQVAGTLVPATWRTVRDWMTEWKKLRSAGTA